MRRSIRLPAAGLILLAGCAAQDRPSPQEERLVDLLRRGRADEAVRDSSRIARALAFYVEELSDPKAVLTATERFWKGYPYSIADLEVDVDLLERVVEKEATARAAIEPATPACKGFSMSEIKPHPADGGRCAWKTYRVLRDRARSIRKGDDYAQVAPLKVLLDFMAESFGPDSFVLLAGLRVEQAGRLVGSTGRDAFALNVLLGTRWDRLLRGHLAWLRARLFTWESDWAEFGEGGEKLQGSGPELDRLASALRQFSNAFWDCRRQKDAREALDRAVAEIDAAAPGTPFPRAARLGRVEAWMHLDRATEALDAFRKRPVADPEEAPRTLLWIAMKLESKDDRAGARALLREIVSTYGSHSSSLRARLCLAEILLEERSENEAVVHLEAVLRKPLPPGDLEDEGPAYAWSEATRLLADVFEGRGDWTRSLILWRDWVPETFCGTCSRQMEEKRRFHVGLALEKLRRPKEAVEEYWIAAPAYEEAAKACHALHARLGTLDELRRRVGDSARKARQHDPDLTGYPGLQWLEASLN